MDVKHRSRDLVFGYPGGAIMSPHADVPVPPWNGIYSAVSAMP